MKRLVKYRIQYVIFEALCPSAQNSANIYITKKGSMDYDIF